MPRPKTNRKAQKPNATYPRAYRITLAACVVVMVVYVALALAMMHDSFWYFATAPLILLAVITFLLWLSRNFEPPFYIAVSLGLLGAVPTLALMLYYFLLLAFFAASRG